MDSATALNIELRDASLQAEGDLEFIGTLWVSKEVPVGFQDIRLNFTLDTDATDEQLATLLRLTERYCVVYQTLPPSNDCHPTDFQGMGKVVVDAIQPKT